MAILFSRSLPKTLILGSIFSRSFLTATGTAVSASSHSSFSRLRRLRPLAAIVAADFGFLSSATSVRDFSTSDDAKPKHSNDPPTFPDDGCDFEHWLVGMNLPDAERTRNEIIDIYIKTLAMVVGSEEEARMKMYSVSTKFTFSFGCLVSEELSHKIKELPMVSWVVPENYINIEKKEYRGEPFVNGQAVPYDPKYHQDYYERMDRSPRECKACKEWLYLKRLGRLGRKE